MAVPRHIDKNRIYYHGTPKKKYVLSIMKNGIQPQSIEFLKSKYIIDGAFMPVENQIYLTTEIRTAISYASDYRTDEPIGYLCVINGNKLKNINPDEDAIGAIIVSIFNKLFSFDFYYRDEYYEFIPLADIAEKLIKKKRSTTYEEFWRMLPESEIGKILLPYLTDEQKYKIIDIWHTVAHIGSIKPDKIYQLKKEIAGQILNIDSEFLEQIYP